MSKLVSICYTDTVPSSLTVNLGVGAVNQSNLAGTATVAPSGYKPAITITGTKLRSVKVPLLSEGYIKSLIVKQSAGTPCAFVVELLSSGMVFPPGEQAVAASEIGTINLFRILPQQSATSGNEVNPTPDTDLGWSWRNMDSDHTNTQRYVYLVIKPTGASLSTSWDAFILAESSSW